MDSLTERQRAEQYIRDMQNDLLKLFGQLNYAVGSKGPTTGGLPIYLDKLTSAHTSVKAALSWAYKASQP